MWRLRFRVAGTDGGVFWQAFLQTSTKGNAGATGEGEGHCARCSHAPGQGLCWLCRVRSHCRKRRGNCCVMKTTRNTLATGNVTTLGSTEGKWYLWIMEASWPAPGRFLKGRRNVARSEELSGLFLGKRTSLQNIADAGWTIRHYTNGWCFEHKESRDQVSLPWWMHQMLMQAEREGAAKARHMIRDAINNDDGPLFGPCGPRLPAPAPLEQ